MSLGSFKIVIFGLEPGERRKCPSNPENDDFGTPGMHFQRFPSPGPKIAILELLGHIFDDFQAQCRKLRLWNSWEAFSMISKPNPENDDLGAPGTHCRLFQSPSQNIAISELLGCIFDDFQTQARKLRFWNSWDAFSTISKPNAENCDFGAPGMHFR